MFVIILAFFLGIIIGFAAIAIRSLIISLSNFFFPGTNSFAVNIAEAEWYKRLIIPILGSLILIPLYYFFTESKGISFHSILSALLFRGGRIMPRTVITKSLATSITLSTGSSAGRETPIIQVGTAIASTLGQLFKLTGDKLKIIVACGAAAGISAAFNTPIAGAVFVVEVFSIDIPISRFSAIITASLMGAITSRLFDPFQLGLFIPEFTFSSYSEFVFYPFLGLLCGLFSLLFIYSLYYSEIIFSKKLKINPAFTPLLGGIFIGVVGVFLPQIMGIGYDSVKQIIQSENTFWLIILLIILSKIIATSVTLSSGGSGGSISPSIFIGALLGFLFFQLTNYLFPNSNISAGGFIIAGMSGLIAGAARLPITAIIIFFEMSGNISLVTPLFLTSVISYLVCTKLCTQSVFTFKFKLNKVNLHKGIDVNILKQLRVAEVYSKNFETVNSSDNFNIIVSKLLKNKNQDLTVIDSRGEIKGVIIANDLKGSVEDKENLQQLLNAGELAITGFSPVITNDNCFAALDVMHKFDLDIIPVIDEKSKRIMGIVERKAIIQSYYKKIETIELINDIASNMVLRDEFNALHLKIGFTITEVVPPICMVGNSLKDLNIYEKFKIDILAIKSNLLNKTEIISNFTDDYVLNEKDSLVIGGDARNIKRFITTKNCN
ncbi:MAG TPA: chloride channel protein [Melioribacteraceae bacterium]|nr:chloride channel protein [Melioribacteraceae bacterium]